MFLIGICWITVSPAVGTGYLLDTIPVTAFRNAFFPDPILNASGTLSREAVKHYPARDAAEALRFTPGIFVDFNGGLGNLASASIHGSESRQVAVYLDGVRINPLANPAADLSRLLLNEIQRIEVIKGAAPARWNSAVGGVINIASREADGRKGPIPEIQAVVGGNDTYIGALTVSGTPGVWSYCATAAHQETDGFIPHSASNQDNARFRLDARVGDRLGGSLVINYMNGWFDNPLPTIESLWEKNASRRFYQVARLEAAPTENLFVKASLRHQRFKNFSTRHQTGEEPEAGSVFNYVENTMGASFDTGWSPEPNGLLHLGFRGDWGTYNFSQAAGDVATRTLSAYAEGFRRMGRWDINGGLRYDEDLDFGSQVSPSLGVVCRLRPGQTRIRAQLAWGFEAPPAIWANDPNFGNPDLKAERAADLEVGLVSQPTPFLKAGVNGFWAFVDNMIVFRQETQRYENVSTVWRRGVESWFSTDLPRHFGLEANLTFVDVTDRETGRVIPDIARLYGSVRLSYSRTRLDQSLTARYADYHSSIPESRDQRFVFDYHIRWWPNLPPIWGKAEVFASLLNVFNTTFYQHPAFPHPDRTFQVGICWRL